MRSRMSMGEDRELLAHRELDDGLVLAAPEQREDAPKDRDRESRYGPHRSRILLESPPRREPESGLTLRLPLRDERGHRREKREQNQHGRILRTHSDPLFTKGFREILDGSGVRPVRLPSRGRI